MIGNVKALQTAFLLVAQKLQEAANSGDVSHNDLCKWLSDACQEIAKPGEFCYFVDCFGDGESGDVVYSLNGDLMKAPYEVQGVTARIDVDAAVDVLVRTTYEPESDDDEHVASMEAEKLYAGGLPLYERFIPKSARASAPAGSFAGKGTSFPILKPEDVQAAVHAIGRAGPENYSADVLKKNIIRITKEKGWTSSLPKAWQGGGDDATGKEAVHEEVKGLRLVESAATLEAIRLVEAKADYEIKLIAPGKGSSAFYPAEVLRRDGPNVFKAGTHVYLNHATAAEEAARPEGDVKNLAGVLTTGAEYLEGHAKGPGLYARMKVFADHAQMVEEKAAHVGMSIRASGVAESGRKQDGLPVLKELTRAESVDVVTRAGAGGMILTEAARGAATNEEEVSVMDANELKLLRESIAALTEKELRREAIAEGARILRDVALPASGKEYVIEAVMRGTLPVIEGKLDTVKLAQAVNAEASRFAAATGQERRVTGMGVAATVNAQESAASSAETLKLQEAEDEKTFLFLVGGNKNAAKFALEGRVA